MGITRKEIRVMILLITGPCGLLLGGIGGVYLPFQLAEYATDVPLVWPISVPAGAVIGCVLGVILGVILGAIITSRRSDE